MKTFLSRRDPGIGLLLGAAFLLSPAAASAQDEVCPPPGTQLTQTSPSKATLTLDLAGFPGVEPDLQLSGDVTTLAVVQDGGVVQTEILSMDLTGSHPQLGQVTLNQSSNPELRSTGVLRGLAPHETPLGDPYCGAPDSFFDVFFDITVVGGEVDLPVLHNEVPLRVVGEGVIPLNHNRFPFQFVQVADNPPTDVLDPTGKLVGTVSNTVHGVEPPGFKRGDCNCDGCVDEQDIECLRAYLEGTGQTCCEDASDANDDGRIDIADLTYLSQYLSVAGAPPPPAPGPDECGPDPTADRLAPCSYPPEACDRECEDSCFPPAGVDIMSSNLFHDIDIVGIGLISGNLSGPIQVRRSDPYIDRATGLQCIDTEIVSLQLTGSDPVAGTINMTLDPCRPSTGRICEKVPGACFPADSFFDVYVRVELPDLGLCLYACQPARMRTVIDRIPPFRVFYNLNIGESDAVPLYKGPCMDECDPALDPCTEDPLPPPVGFIRKAVHQPLPPEECDCFPEAGQDILTTTLGHAIDLPGFNLTCSSFAGPIVVQRSDPYLNADGQCVIDTEIIRMEMTGTCQDGTPAVIRLNPDRPSKGFIQALEPGTCYPARSCFNVFFELEVQLSTGPVVFRNCEPAIMCCEIEDLPPLGCPYQLQNAPIPLYQVVPGEPSPCIQDPRPNPAGQLENANHTPEEVPDPCCPEYGPGVDIFDSSLLHDIDIPGVGLISANLRGPVRVVRGTPYVNPLTGLCCVDVEMVEMQLVGNDPTAGRIVVTLDPRRASRGRICELEQGTCFPARSCFEMYVRVELPDLGLVLVACEPAEMCCIIEAIPPYGCLYNLDIGDGEVIPLYEELATTNVCDTTPPVNPRAFIVKAVHEPEPPCDHYPPAGDDNMQSELTHRIRLFGLGPDDGDLICDADMHGPLVVHREDPQVDPVTGHCTIPTEIVQLELTGDDPVCGPVTIRLNPDRRSLGRITEIEPGSGFPADSFFDVFVEIEIPNEGLVLINCTPIRMERVIDAIPPINQSYLLWDLVDVPLYRRGECATLPDPDLLPTGVIEFASNVPREPCDCPELGPGVDVMDASLEQDIVLYGLGDQLCQTPLRGRVVVERGVPYAQTLPDGTVVCCVSTRLREMTLVGEDPVCGTVEVRLSPDRVSRGTICALEPGTCLPAVSCFDVFVEILVEGLVLVNCEPIRMCCDISSIPPHGCTFGFEPKPVLPQLYEKGSCDDTSQPPAGELRLAEITPIPCPPRDVQCKLDPDTGEVTVSWVNDPDCPCERYVVTRTNPDGTTVDIPVEPGATQVIDSIECPPGATGVLNYRYCVACVIEGVSSDVVCCEVELNCEPCEIESVNCDPGGDQVVITWTVSDPDCCERFQILMDGNEVATAAGSDRSATVPCVPGTHEFCVVCILPDGTPLPIDTERHCCTVTCPCTDEQSTIIDLECVPDPANNAVTLTWDVADPECCQGFRVTLPDGGTIDVSDNSLTRDCVPGDYCVQCIHVDGTLGPQECCVVTCEPEGGLQRPCDCTQDNLLDISDGICILGFLFLGNPPTLPCGDGTGAHPANLKVMDCDGSGALDLTDAIYTLSFLFLGGPPPAAGVDCIRVPECPDVCQPAGNGL